jgi:hypothetical protein
MDKKEKEEKMTKTFIDLLIKGIENTTGGENNPLQIYSQGSTRRSFK